ncbi:phosphate starvation-inducible protein [Bordetella pertussis]|nr:phosphate starvation-inducible protein [Bordetella pertussis]
MSLFCSTAAWAQASASKELTPQQKRMAECNKSATRKAYMSTCLSGKS